MKPLTLGSLFDGSGGFPLGGILSGIVPVWASEIEPFPIAVTMKNFPFMKHYGDISELNGAEIEPVDIITFGSPCQDMSVAGKRSGLEGSRSSLFFQAIRIIKEMRGATDGKYPRYIVWENVQGAFSSNKGEDFRAVLEQVCSVKDAEISVPRHEKWENAGCIVGDDFSVAWRLLDAQYWGVPQRRQRIYLVADFAGNSAGDILFESEGLSGYSAEGFRAWQKATGAIGESTEQTGTFCLNDQGGNCISVTENFTSTLRAESHNHEPIVIGDAIPIENHPTDGRVKVCTDGKVQTLTSRMGTGGMNVPLLLKIRCGCAGGGKGALIQVNKSATIACNNDQTLFQPYVKGTRPHSAQEAPTWKEGDVANTLNTFDIGEGRCNELVVKSEEPVCYGIVSKSANSMKSDNPYSGFYEADTARTIDANGGNPNCNQGGIAVVQKGDVLISSKAYFMTEFMDDKACPLVATDYKDPPVLMQANPAGFYPQKKAESMCMTDDRSVTLINGTNPGFQNGVIDCEDIVRRLTPTECARLQGFPDWWCSDLGNENPCCEDVDEWERIFETHRKLVSGASKPKTRKQIVKWLGNPHTDAAEYKMWGNGVALPNVTFVLSGIAWADERSKKHEKG